MSEELFTFWVEGVDQETLDKLRAVANGDFDKYREDWSVKYDGEEN